MHLAVEMLPWAFLLGSATFGITKSAIRVSSTLIPWGPTSTGKYWTTLLFLLVVFGTHGLVRACDHVPWIFRRLFTSFKPIDVDTWKAACMGHVMLSAVSYHLLLAASLWGVHESSHARSIIQNGCWPLKVLGLLLLAAGSMCLVPLSLLHWFFQFSLLAAGVFLLMQAVLVLDFVYEDGEALQARLEHSPDNRNRRLLVASLGAGLWVFVVTWLALQAFVFETRNPVIVGLCVAQALLQCSLLALGLGAHRRTAQFEPLGSVYISSLVCACTTFVLSEAIDQYHRTRPAQSLLSAALFAFSLAYAAYSVGLQPEKLQACDFEYCGRGHRSSAPGGSEWGDKDVCYNMSFFHVMHALASCYAYLVFSHWSDFVASPRTGIVYSVANANWSFVYKLLSCSALSGLYLWSLVAPLVWGDRNFSGPRYC